MGLGLLTERRGLTSDKKNGMLIDLPCGVTGGRSPPSPRRRLQGRLAPLPRVGRFPSGWRDSDHYDRHADLPEVVRQQGIWH